ncbi:DUF2202 domain-containing protein [Candidatus Sulfidibacterium hydrothermale]|uniref:DUF2202 domain-containing protein n=1 Tax=Candidatus Sulfidibacterium hydrothermale TaxID=2875962 RepID=UPI001F0A2843|nr:DUF2202 domain-containing protein [Candidatus Sulfidibacterium hydrothermale]UBM63090.1 DUF2202 domain-containing protein [Candidatus Sulfidibacterium hydrothermale]
MKSLKYSKLWSIIPSILLALIIGNTFLFSGCDDSSDNPTPKLNAEDSTMVVHMREEEKLARDVYTALYDKWGLRVFTNIARSEQTHMDEVLKLLNKYGIPDPASSEPGKFNNPDLQALYTSLVAKGDSSLTNSLLVGATIEDLDIYDLEEYMSKTTNQDILNTFQFLTCGSRNHMRSFVSQLQVYDITYTPVYISQTEFDDIINSPSEQCGLQ